MKLYRNATIRTMQSEGHIQEAAVIDHGRFVFVGSEEEARRRFPSIDEVDCDGMVMLPGFNDSHMHLLGYGMTLSQLDLSQSKSIQDIQDQIIEFAENSSFIYGRGWNQDYLKENRMPTRHDLDLTGIADPIILTRACGHILCCNSVAMDLAGVYHEEGLFCEHEMDALKAILPQYTPERLKRFLEDAERHLLSFGITAVQSDDLAAVTESDHEMVLDTLQNMEHLIRVYEQTNYHSYEQFINNIPHYKQDRTSCEKFRMGPIKLLGDGSLGAHTARLIEPYHDDPGNKGLLNFTEDQLMHIAALCEKHQADMAIHAIGDQMVEYAIKMASGSNLRHAIVHSQVTNQRLIERISEEGLLLHIQPVFLHYDMHIAEDRLGPLRVRDTYNYKTLIDKGIPVGFGTDCPVEPPNPFYGLYSAITRKDRRGYPEKGWFPEEALTLYQALVQYTHGSAYGSHDENLLGRIAPGYLADFILLKEDPFSIQPDGLLDIKVHKTYVGGELLYENKN